MLFKVHAQAGGSQGHHKHALHRQQKTVALKTTVILSTAFLHVHARAYVHARKHTHTHTPHLDRDVGAAGNDTVALLGHGLDGVFAQQLFLGRQRWREHVNTGGGRPVAAVRNFGDGGLGVSVTEWREGASGLRSSVLFCGSHSLRAWRC